MTIPDFRAQARELAASATADTCVDCGEITHTMIEVGPDVNGELFMVCHRHLVREQS